MNENKPHEATPDQLLQMMDLQLAAARSRRASDNTSKRLVTLVGGLLLILGGCFAALLILQQILAEVPRPEAPASSVEALEGQP